MSELRGGRACSTVLSPRKPLCACHGTRKASVFWVVFDARFNLRPSHGPPFAKSLLASAKCLLRFRRFQACSSFMLPPLQNLALARSKTRFATQNPSGLWPRSAAKTSAISAFGGGFRTPFVRSWRNRLNTSVLAVGELHSLLDRMYRWIHASPLWACHQIPVGIFYPMNISCVT